jgi:hypothetical protein
MRKVDRSLYWAVRGVCAGWLGTPVEYPSERRSVEAFDADVTPVFT